MENNVWMPTVGDSVRVKDNVMAQLLPGFRHKLSGGTGVVVEVDNSTDEAYWVEGKNGRVWMRADELEPAAPAPPVPSSAGDAVLSDLAAQYRKAKLEREQSEYLSSPHEAFYAAEYITVLEARITAAEAKADALAAALKRIAEMDGADGYGVCDEWTQTLAFQECQRLAVEALAAASAQP